MDRQTIVNINRQLIQNDIIDQLHRVEPKITKSKLARALDVSRSFITQLYSGNRSLNLEHLAKMQSELNLKVRITFEDAELIRIQNDPKRFSMKYIDSSRQSSQTSNLDSIELFSIQA